MAAITTNSASASTVNVLPQPRPQVFINFRGEDLRENFITHLERAFKENDIKYYIDTQEVRSEPIEILFKRIKESKIALAIFSERYAESSWCLDELVEIMKNVLTRNHRVIPVFFKVDPEEVKEQTGHFGVKLYGQARRKRPNMKQWEDALESVPAWMGLTLAENGSHDELLLKIVHSIKELEPIISSENTNISTLTCTGDSSSATTTEQYRASPPPYGTEQPLKQLEEKLDFDYVETQIVGIIGMARTGKTTLAKRYFEKWENKFTIKEMVMDIREKSTTPDWLMNKLLNGQEEEKAQIFTRKVLLVLDDVSDKNQIEFLHRNLNRIKEGSKIVITARDKSSIDELVHDTYVVPGLIDNEALKLFNDHAFKDHQVSTSAGKFPMLSNMFVDYAGGNPGALVELGKELCERDESHWEGRLKTLPHRCNEKILTQLRISYNKLNGQQKDAFLDIACFFRSEEEDYVKCLLDPYAPESGEAVTDLVEKFFICVSAGRIEMHNLMCTFGKELGSSDENMSGERMWDHVKITKTLSPGPVTINQIKQVRGIILDTSKVENGIAIDPTVFKGKFNKLKLRYLKIYDSLCPQQCNVDCKLNLPDGLEFPFPEVRYFHWLKFPYHELPGDFDPENLIDLRLPYSKIECVWKAVKETPWLKWVDLSYSTRLIDLSALSKAYHLRRLNLEGCEKLEELPKQMKNMKSLVFLNLRGCTSLTSLPRKLDLVSLKTLILSGCSNFRNFELKSENLEFLHLDGTAITGLPSSIRRFQKLVLLNLKDCKILNSLPDCIDKLKALEELILSGCERFRSFPDIKEKMENLQILLLDGTKIEDLPKVLLHFGNNFNDQAVLFQRSPQMHGLSMLRRLCLSRNDTISSLQSSISQLYHLKWIDLKYCKNLRSISTLPPNLHCLDAHACTSLKTVASPLALLMPAQQVPSSFIFTNCEKLEHVAKNEIICYAHNKSRMISHALNRHNKGLAFEALVATCFPGSEVPAWFSHRTSGAVYEAELPRHWSKSGFVGIALCAIVSFENHKVVSNNLQVKGICKFKNSEISSSYFDCHIGGLSETADEQRTINSTHVFIGYTNLLNINKCQEGDDGQEGCVPTKALIKFEVTDGTGEVTSCKVQKCGFSLVYESGSWRTEDLGESENRWLGLLRTIRRFLKL